MTDKLVTHQDLNTIEDARRWIANVPVGHEVNGKARVLDLLDRLRVEAEADAPPLPEGWVAVTVRPGSEAVFWHRDGGLYQWADDDEVWEIPQSVRKTLTPLRPTVTAEDVEKAAEAARGKSGYYPWGAVDESMRDAWRKIARTAFEAVGIEVRDV